MALSTQRLRLCLTAAELPRPRTCSSTLSCHSAFYTVLSYGEHLLLCGAAADHAVPYGGSSAAGPVENLPAADQLTEAKAG